MIHNEYPKKYLYPSSILVSGKPSIIKTVLGSCVAVCMFDNENKVGGINHFMLPFWRGNELATPKFGSIAMERLLKKMLNIGADKQSLVAKVFGGAGILNYPNDHYGIGKKNIEVAKMFLRESGIPIVNSDVAGNQGRKIMFNTDSGDVYLKRINPSMNLVSEEI
ncbi:MAG: chemotaxis protein CheD [Cyclobacteriaceae bacterium]|nr:chemotaxis protein CheD [Cyclobacteriaceae bacterium]